MTQPRLILASSSPYRARLLERLQLSFEAISPDVDEAEIDSESASQMAARLARSKALAVASVYPDAFVIGSDQTVACDNEVLNKPGQHDQALHQLKKLSGNSAVFHTGLSLYLPVSASTQDTVVDFTVTFRQLDPEEIARYLHVEQPYDCAGSFKSEALGITLLEKMHGDDPTALVGLPLIALSSMLRQHGFQLP